MLLHCSRGTHLTDSRSARTASPTAESDSPADRSAVGAAGAVGCRQGTLNRIEQGKHSPSVSTIEKIDRVLKAAGEVEEPDVGPLLPAVRAKPKRKQK